MYLWNIALFPYEINKYGNIRTSQSQDRSMAKRLSIDGYIQKKTGRIIDKNLNGN